MKKPHKAVITALLPQNQSSELIRGRMVEAIHFEDTEIERVDNNLEPIAVREKELDSDALCYFYENKESFRDEFIDELEQCDISSDEYVTFCDVIAKEWITGFQSERVLRLKKSVHDYFQEKFRGHIRFDEIIQKPINELSNVKPLISTETISKILSINHQMLYEHIEKWKDLHPNHDNISSSDVFLRRGLQLGANSNTSKQYIEQDFISSYSMAVSVAEQFSQFESPNFPVHINGELALFEQRILFFSPFIPNMEVQELEFGVIPSENPLPIHYQGKHGGIHEYIIDPAPFQKAQSILDSTS